MASKMGSKASPATRHVISINDLSDKDIETIFDAAQSYLKQLPDKHYAYRIGRSTDVGANHILASLFYEPSTRTRLSFESAMIRLGGQTITSADPATSSAAKGESLADTVRVLANYADIMVIRHPRDGAARLAAEYSPIPVINGGDGSHEHPTQTLCDLFTLKQKNKRLKNLKVAISGDLKGSRTIHSFVYALARFGATIMPMPAKGMELPAHVDQRLREEFRCHMVPVPKGDGDEASIDALYVTPEEPHQQSLFAGPEIERDIRRDLGMVDKKVDAVYVTRFQKERWAEKDQAYPRIDRQFLKEPKYSEASVMHPLPRVGELDADFDSDRRAVYFEQAAYGVPIRMALIALLLGLKGKSLHRFEGGFAQDKFPVYEQPRSLGLHCTNSNCIVHDPMEAQYVRNKFYVVQSGETTRLRCVYCEREIERFVVANKKNKWYATDAPALMRSTDHALKDFVLFADEADAQAGGFHSRRAAAEAPVARRAGGRSKI
jgi:aspartate carbamoyltransferase catalytic subunit